MLVMMMMTVIDEANNGVGRGEGRGDLLVQVTWEGDSGGNNRDNSGRGRERWGREGGGT